MQRYTSANTSISGKVNRIYKFMVENGFPKGTTILDFGCGKYDNNKEFAEANGFEWYGYDPYNRTDEYNLRTTDRFDEEYPDVIVCSNVLNVIDSDEAIDELLVSLTPLYPEKEKKVKYFFTIFEGEGNGIGRVTKSDCWQRNEPTNLYLPKLQKHFRSVNKLKGESNIICCYA